MEIILTIIYCFLLTNSVLGFDLKNYKDGVLKMALNDTIVKEFEKHINRIIELEPSYFKYNPFDAHLKAFNCPIIPPSDNVKSVHELKISNVKAVGALGDSLTAALGADAATILGLLTEYRGFSFSAGGVDTLEKVVTMPNIAKKYNKNLVGFSTGNDLTISPFGRSTNHFNVAISGQEANHIPEQARELVSRMKKSKEFNYQTDWKLINLFIGGNDLCDYCKDTNLHSPQSYINFIQEGLDILYKELPKTFVSLITVMRIYQVTALNDGILCSGIHSFECPCGAFPENSDAEKLLIQTFEQYVNYTNNLVNSNRYERDDFTVVVQPFMQDMEIPKNSKGDVDLSYFAPDCFHFSRKGHSQSAIALWNNMFTAVGSKKTKWDLNEQIFCPTADKPYLCTRQNNC